MASNIEIKVTADNADFLAKMAVSRAEMSAARKALNDLARDAAANGWSAATKAQAQEAATAFLTAQASIQEFQKKLDTIKPPSDLNSRLKTALSAVELVASAALIERAFHLVGDAIENTVGKATEFEISNAKFAAQMGISHEAAAGLGGALGAVGVSTDDYTGMVLKLERQVKTNEGSLRSLGVATRDHNGQLLNGVDLMNSALSTMQQYRAGTDQNEFALSAFGRSAAGVYDLMRVSKGMQQEFNDKLREFGVDVGPGATKAALENEEAFARFKMNVEAAEISVGRRLTPVLTSLMNYFNGEGGTAIRLFTELILGAAESTMWASAVIATGYTRIEEAVRITADVVVGSAKMIKSAATLDFDGIGKAATSTWDHISSDWKNGGAKVTDIWSQYAADIKTINSTIKTPTPGSEDGDNPFKSGNRSFVAPSNDKKEMEQARRAADEIAQVQQQAAEKHIQVEEQTNSFLLSMGQKSLEAWKAQADQLEEDRYQAELKGIQRREQADRGDLAAFSKDKAQENALYQEHTDRLTGIDQQYQQKKKQMQENTLQEFIRTEQERLQEEISTLNTEEQVHQISADTKHRLEVQLTRQIQGEVLTRFDAERGGQAKGTAAYTKYCEDRAALEASFTKKVTTANNQFLSAEMQKWHTLADSIKGSVGSALDNLIFHGGSLRDFMVSIAEGIGEAFLQMGVDLVANWIETMVFSKAAGSTNALAQIGEAAGVGYANAYAATSAIPIIGPGLAPGVAAATAATILANGAAIAAFDVGTNVLPADMLAMVHAGERIIPAADNSELMTRLREPMVLAGLPDAFRDFTRNNQQNNSSTQNNIHNSSSSSSRGGDTHNTALTIHGGPDLKSMLRDNRNKRELKNLLRAMQRSGAGPR